MSYRLGVDLGTTFTAAAVANGGPPTMLGLGNRALQVPSVLYLPPDGDLVVGEAAERRGLTDPTRLVREFKRRIGDHVPILVAGVPYSPQSLTAQLLQWVVQAGTEQMGEPPSRTILTYPANWGPYKRELLSQVVEIADVGDVVTCSEPEAAAVQYAAKSRVQPGARIAMYDLGGGTFDTCVLEKSDSGFVMLGEPIGIEHLGGIDFDDAVFQHVLESVNDQLPGLDPAEEGLQAGLARLRRDCVDAKEALSSDVQAIVPVTLPGLSTSVRLTRSELEELLRPPLEQTVAALGRALRSASVEPSDLHAIVLVGGGSRIPLVRELLQQAYPVRTALDTHPKHDVALGAVQVDAPARPDSRPVPRPLPAPGPRATPAGPVTPATPKPTPKPRPTSKPTPRSRLAPDPRLMPDPRLTPGPRPTPEPQATPEPAPEPEAQALPVPPAPEPLTEVLPTTPVPPLPVQPAGSPSPRHDRTGGGRRPRLPGAIRPRQLAIGGGAAALALVVAIGLLNRGGDEGGPGPGSTTPAATAAPGDLPASTPLTAQQLLVPMKVNDAGDTDIFLADIGISSPIKRLTSIPGPDTAPALSPDRRSAIFVHIEGKRTLWVMAADGSGARELFDPAPPECVNAFRPAWSPADPTLLAMACEDAAGTRGLYLVRIDGKELLKLPVEQPLMDDPAFSPDGRTLSYWAGAESPLDGGSIYTLEIEGGSPRRLTEVAPGIDADPAWSPDGSTIAFRRRVADGTSHGNFEIFTVPSDGSGSARGLIEGPADDQDPSWSPSGDQLAVKSNRLQSGGGTGRARVWLVRADGTDSRLLWSTGANGEQSAPAWTRR